VAILLALKFHDGSDSGSAILFLEEGCLKGLARHPLKVPSLHYALRAHNFTEFTVETILGSIGVYVGEVPSTTRADVHLFDCHLVFSGFHPLEEALWIGLCLEDEVAGRLESPNYVDLSIVRGRDQGGFRGRL